MGAVSGSLGETVQRDMSQLRETCLSRVETLVSQLESRCEAQLKTRDQQIETLNGKQNGYKMSVTFVTHVAPRSSKTATQSDNKMIDTL